MDLFDIPEIRLSACANFYCSEGFNKTGFEWFDFSLHEHFPWNLHEAISLVSFHCLSQKQLLVDVL